MSRMSQAMNIMKMGFRGGVIAGATGKALLRGGSTMAWNGIKGMGTFWNLKDYKKQAGIIKTAYSSIRSRTINMQTLQASGRASANLLGKGAGIVMGVKAIGSRRGGQEGKVRSDVPFIPFI